MRQIQTLTQPGSIKPEEINADNYQIVGRNHSAQILYNTEFNEYRTNIDYTRGENRENYYINGWTNKRFNTLYGEISIEVPILRKKGFCPSFINLWKRDSKELEELIFFSFMNGESTRDIEATLKKLNIKCSKSKVSRINKRFYSQKEELENRDLSTTDYCIVSLDATYVAILSDDPDSKHYSKKPVLRALGLNTETGYWELLSLRVYEHENATAYIQFLEDLKKRGLDNPAIILCDQHKGISKATKQVFPLSFRQACLFHHLQNVYKYLPRRVEKELKDQIYNLVREENPDLRRADLEDIIRIYGEEYPKAVKTLENNLEECTAWTVLNCEFKTNNVNERNNEEDKRLIKAKGSFKSVRSAELILITNTLNYLTRISTKKAADLDKIRDMNRRFKAISGIIQGNLLSYLTGTGIPETPPSFSTPVLWLDTIDIPYECFGQTVYVKILTCYGLKKAHRRRHFLWACPLFNYNPEEMENILTVIKDNNKKTPEIIILPASDSILLKSIENVFSESNIQVDLNSFKETMLDLLPESYQKAFAQCFDSAFEHGEKKGFTKEILELIEKSLSHHHLEEALKLFNYFKGYLLTFLKIGINYAFNFKSTKNLKSGFSFKRDASENNYAFFKRTLEAIRIYTWDIPCVYMDEVKLLYERF